MRSADLLPPAIVSEQIDLVEEDTSGALWFLSANSSGELGETVSGALIPCAVLPS